MAKQSQVPLAAVIKPLATLPPDEVSDAPSSPLLYLQSLLIFYICYPYIDKSLLLLSDL